MTKPPVSEWSVEDVQRFYARSHRQGSDPDKCWVWYPNRPMQYGKFTALGHEYLAHRAAFELHYGYRPKITDHLCGIRGCTNPLDLESLESHKANILRGVGPTAQNARAIRCPKNHLLTGVNLYLDKRGRRACRQCRRARDRARWKTHRTPDYNALKGQP